MWTRSFLGAAVDTGLLNLYFVYMAVTKSATSHMGFQILGLLMYDGPRPRDFRDPDDPSRSGSYWLWKSQISMEYMALVIKRACWMAPGYRKRIPRAGSPPRKINGRFEQITVVISWLIFLQLSCRKLYDIVFPSSNHRCHASSSMAAVNKAWSTGGKKSMKRPNRSMLGDFETSQMLKTFSSIISVTWWWQAKFSAYMPISFSNKMQTSPFVPVFDAIVAEDLDMITLSFITCCQQLHPSLWPLFHQEVWEQTLHYILSWDQYGKTINSLSARSS